MLLIIKIKSNPQKIKPTLLSNILDLSPLKRPNCLSIASLLDLLLGKHYQEGYCNDCYEMSIMSTKILYLPLYPRPSHRKESTISSLDAKNQIKKILH